MPSMNSSFKTILSENLRRFWPIPVLSFAAYLLAGILPILLNYRSFADISWYAISLVRGSSFTIFIILFTTAVVASMAVFSYLHDPVASGTIHSMPVKRSGLFAASVLSGWLFVMVPAIITGFLFSGLRGAAMGSNQGPIISGSFGTVMEAKDVFTLSHSFGFIATCLFTGTFIYAVCCLAAVISGKQVIHVLLSCFLNIMPLSVVALVDAILSGFLFGYTSSVDPVYRYVSPFMYTMVKEGFRIQWRGLAYYMILAVILLVVSFLIYRKVKLERVGQASTFPAVADVLCVVLTFLGSMGFSLLLVWLMSGNTDLSEGRFAITMILSSMVIYIIMRMIADSTPAVFTFTTVKKYAVFLVIALVFMAFAVFDATGYGKWLPDQEDISSVTVTTDLHSNSPKDMEYKDPEMIRKFVDLQKYAQSKRTVDSDRYDSSYVFTLKWKQNDGKEIRRQYDIKAGWDFKDSEKVLAPIFEDKEFKKNILIDESNIDKSLAYVKSISVEGFDDYATEENVVYIDKKDYKELIHAMNQDTMEKTYKQHQSTDWDYTISFNGPDAEDPDDPAAGSYPDDPNPFAGYYDVFRLTNKHTTGFLKDKGYLDRITIRHAE